VAAVLFILAAAVAVRVFNGLGEDRREDYGTTPFVPAASPESTGPHSR
jgi:hypothetical protein